MKVVLATAFPRDPWSPCGGVEAVSVVLARALAAIDGMVIHVVTANEDEAHSATLEWNGVTVHRLPWDARWMLTGAAGASGRIVLEYVEALQPDVVHAHDTYGIMLRACTRPRVLTIHGFIHGDTLVSGEPGARVRAMLWRRIETAAWARYPHLISISPYVRERVSGLVHGSIHDIDNPIDDRFFAAARRDEEGRIFSAATLTPRKNPLALIEAVGRLTRRGVRNLTLRLAGPQPQPAYTASVQRRIAELGLSDQVVLLPSLSTEKVIAELEQARVAALVSLEENSPLTIEEAMAAGVPVVTSNRCGMPYLVSEGDTGFLVDPQDPDEIADRLQLLLEDPKRRAQMGARAQAVARERFAPASVALRTSRVYRRALERRTRSAA